jgi:protein-S-isoprenylcysteine O-methyltransferase Ste14
VGVIRLLLTITWAAWIWFELMAVLGPALVELLRGRGRRQDAASAAMLLACAGVAFWAAIRLSRLSPAALPAPPVAALAAGLALMWLGLGLRVWAIQYLRGPGGLLRAATVIPRDRRLVTTGPYRHLRHPACTGALLAAAGFGIALGHWSSVLVLVAGWAAGFAIPIRVEETALRRAFGPAYDDYASRTRRLFPGLY